MTEADIDFRVIADVLPQLMWAADVDGFIFWYNRRWYDYTGKTPDEVRGWGWQTAHNMEMLPRVIERWTASIKTGVAFDMEFQLRGADGQLRWFLTRANPLLEGGRVRQWFGTHTDIDEQKRAEETAKETLRTMIAQVQHIASSIE